MKNREISKIGLLFRKISTSLFATHNKTFFSFYGLLLSAWLCKSKRESCFVVSNS